MHIPSAVTLREQAYGRFCDAVLAGQLQPGQFVSQRELTELLQMPLGAIREMIPRLEAALLLVTVPKRGLQIPHADLKLIRNAFHVRTMIEKEAVAHFAATATDADLAEIRRQHEWILERALREEEDPSLDADAQCVDWAFHDRMVDALDNEILSEIYKVNTLHVKLIRLESRLARPMRVIPAMREHLHFLDMLSTRDVPAAVQAMVDHIEASRERVMRRATRSVSDPAVRPMR